MELVPWHAQCLKIEKGTFFSPKLSIYFIQENGTIKLGSHLATYVNCAIASKIIAASLHMHGTFR